jgi:hypothetical protein
MKKILVLLLSASVSLTAISQAQLTYPDLVQRLYDMEYVATPPQDGERSGNFSSFDRRSVYNPETETYEHWDANGDGRGFIRNEGEGTVIFEKEGPGVIWRFWSALARDGKIRVYIDHAEEPVIAAPFRTFFEQFDTLVPIINLPNLAMTLSRGRNRWMPIPYNQHCKIVLEKGWGAYYHITHTTYPAGTGLPDYTGNYSREDAIALAVADRVLESRGYQRTSDASEKVVYKEVDAGPNSTMTVSTIKGNRAITHLKLRYDEQSVPTAEARKEMLENLWIRITWDDDDKPSVMAPVGLFFGTYPDIYPYRAYPVGAIPGYFYSNWFMPFSDQAKLEVVNQGDQAHDISLEVVHKPLGRSAEELLRFHAKWHQGLYKEEVQSGGREIDWPLLVTRGTGRFCGVTLHIRNEWEIPEEEPVTWWYGAWDKKTIDWWWGEGDEKFYVDGEKFPSTYGTGSEDYIGYAWSAEPPFSLFDSPFATQPYTPIDGNGHTIVSRFHIADNVPFRESFSGVIEKYKGDRWGENNTCLFQAVAYWYLSPGEMDTY